MTKCPSLRILLPRLIHFPLTCGFGFACSSSQAHPPLQAFTPTVISSYDVLPRRICVAWPFRLFIEWTFCTRPSQPPSLKCKPSLHSPHPSFLHSHLSTSHMCLPCLLSASLVCNFHDRIFVSCAPWCISSDHNSFWHPDILGTQ